MVAAKRISSNTVEAVELKALVWAMNIAAENNWIKVEWRSDARGVVAQALALKKMLRKPDWSIFWVLESQTSVLTALLNLL